MDEHTLSLVRGTLDLLILKTLVWEPLHGYAITRSIKLLTEGALVVEEGALYPALHRLESKGLVEVEGGVSENNRKAKFYQLTALGRKQLLTDTKTWKQYAEAVAKVLSAAGPAEENV